MFRVSWVPLFSQGLTIAHHGFIIREGLQNVTFRERRGCAVIFSSKTHRTKLIPAPGSRVPENLMRRFVPSGANNQVQTSCKGQ
jgi:hypothetical protein